MSLIVWEHDVQGEGYRIRAGFTTRHGGVSTGDYESFNLGYHVDDKPEDVTINRRLLADDLGVEPAWMDQVHGVQIAQGEAGIVCHKTDGLVISLGEREKAAGCVMVADCVPLILMSQSEARGLVVHVGRQGFMKGIVERALDIIGRDCHALIGPSICGRCYELPPDVCESAGEIAPTSVCQTHWGTTGVDVGNGIREILERYGVREIWRSDKCTFEDENLFSYRRASKKAAGKTGRLAGVLLIEKV